MKRSRSFILAVSIVAAKSLLSASPAHARAWSCPAGMRLYGTPGSAASFCIDINRSPWIGFDTAKANCADQGKSLCGLDEWHTMCNDLAPRDTSTAPPDGIGGPVAEWVDVPTSSASLRFGANLDVRVTVGGTGCGAMDFADPKALLQTVSASCTENTSTSLTACAGATFNLAIGSAVVGPKIPLQTTITANNAAGTLTISAAATAAGAQTLYFPNFMACNVTLGSTTLTACASSAVTIGSTVTGLGIPANTIVTGTPSSTTVTMSQPAIAPAMGGGGGMQNLTFGPAYRCCLH